MRDLKVDAAYEAWARTSLRLAPDGATHAAFLAGAVFAQRPIPVGERLPEDGVRVLGYVPAHWRYEIVHVRDRRWFWERLIPVDVVVSHWCPIPPRPTDPTSGDVP